MKKKIRRFISALAAAALLLPTAACMHDEQSRNETVSDDSSFILAASGKVSVPVVVPDDADEKATAAAQDFVSMLSRITGDEEIKLVSESELSAESAAVFIGHTDRLSKLGIDIPSGYPGEEKCVVVQTDNSLFLAGNDSGEYTGTRFAVTMLLEHLGCGWFGTDELWHIIPSLSDIDLTGLKLENTPVSSMRRTRISSDDPELAMRWYEGGIHSLTGHWLPQVCPAELYSEHEDWYALVDGSRDPSRFDYWHYCYTNEELAAFIAERVIEKFPAEPQLVSLTIAANDGWNEGWCTCDTCTSAGNAADQLVCFANNVAKLVYDRFPDKLLQIYSYHRTFPAPLNSVPLEGNVELILCREAPMQRALDEEYVYPAGIDQISQIEFTRSWLANARDYIEKTSAQHVAIWDWYCVSAHLVDWQKVFWVQGEVAERNLKTYLSLGASYVYYDHGPLDSYNEPSPGCYDVRWPLWYVAAKLSWDSSLTAEMILRDACEKLYGDAAEPMYDFYKALSDASASCEAYSNTWVPPQVREMYLEAKEEINEAIESAVAMSDTLTTEQKARIDNQFEYWQHMLRFLRTY